MFKMISRFASSPFSGYALIGILAALAAGGYWFWSELKEFGSLEVMAQQQATTIAEQQATLEQLNASITAKDAALTEQGRRTSLLLNNARLQQLAVMEARKHADKVTRECMALNLADSLQFGPSSQDRDSEDKARSAVDG